MRSGRVQAPASMLCATPTARLSSAALSITFTPVVSATSPSDYGPVSLPLPRQYGHFAE